MTNGTWFRWSDTFGHNIYVIGVHPIGLGWILAATELFPVGKYPVGAKLHNVYIMSTKKNYLNICCSIYMNPLINHSAYVGAYMHPAQILVIYRSDIMSRSDIS